MMPAPAAAEALPKWQRYLGIPLIGLFLTLFFIHLGFPYEPLVARAFRIVHEEHAVSISFDQVSSHLGPFGPGVAISNLVVSRPGSDDIEFSELILRAAWSTTWFRGQPSVHIDAQMLVGRVSGAIAIGDPLGFDGSLDGLDLATLPTKKYAAGVNLRGSLNADIDLHYDAEGSLIGSAELEAEAGSLGLRGQPIAIPYDSFDAELVFSPEDGAFLTIESAELAGPMISGSASGQIARGSGGPGEIDLELELAVVDLNLQPLLRDLGVRLDGDGRATARLGGTLARPALR